MEIRWKRKLAESETFHRFIQRSPLAFFLIGLLCWQLQLFFSKPIQRIPSLAHRIACDGPAQQHLASAAAMGLLRPVSADTAASQMDRTAVAGNQASHKSSVFQLPCLVSQTRAACPVIWRAARKRTSIGSPVPTCIYRMSL